MTIKPRIILSDEVSEDLLHHIFNEQDWEVLYNKEKNTFTLVKMEKVKQIDFTIPQTTDGTCLKGIEVTLTDSNK